MRVIFVPTDESAGTMAGNTYAIRMPSTPAERRPAEDGHETRPKVLFVASWYPSDSDPVRGIFVRAHVRAAARYQRVSVVACRFGPAVVPHGSDGAEDPVPTHRVHLPRLAGRLSRLEIPASVVALFFATAWFTARTRPDVIHANTYETALSAGLVGRLFRTPVVVTEHYTGFTADRMGGARATLARLGYRLVDRVLPVAASLGDAIASHGIGTPQVVVPNAIDTAVFAPAATRPSRRGAITFVGALTERKGVDVALDALALLDPAVTGHLTIVGEGSERAALEQHAQSLGLSHQVTFTGRRSPQEIAEILRESDCLVLPSWSENLPCVILEALCVGVPVVATTVGGVPEVIDDHNGRLVPPGDAAALADALRDVLAGAWADPPRIASDAASSFSLEAVGRRLDAVYRDVVGLPGVRR